MAFFGPKLIKIGLKLWFLLEKCDLQLKIQKNHIFSAFSVLNSALRCSFYTQKPQNPENWLKMRGLHGVLGGVQPENPFFLNFLVQHLQNQENHVSTIILLLKFSFGMYFYHWKLKIGSKRFFRSILTENLRFFLNFRIKNYKNLIFTIIFRETPVFLIILSPKLQNH